MKLQTLILAAGKGTRMYSKLPKVMHSIAGRSMLVHVWSTASALKENDIYIIYGFAGEQIKTAHSDIAAKWILQHEQLGTGHAVMQAQNELEDDSIVLILFGDVPLIGKDTLEGLIAKATDKSMILITMNVENPFGYGRIVRNRDGKIIKIVEEKDATGEEKLIKEVNTGIMAVPGNMLKRWLILLRNHNVQKEYYLTDIIQLAVNDGVEVLSAQPEFEYEVLGVNTKIQLHRLERIYQTKQAEMLMSQGVTFMDAARFDLRGELIHLGQDVEIDVNVIIEGRVSIGDGVYIGPNTIIKNSVIHDNVEIHANCIIENSVVGKDCRIGPYARLRPDTILDSHVHIGNFVELKKTSIAEGSKINHLSYVGDATVGRHVNIGAGTITCNYDGVNKHHTVIGDGAFIGSDTQLVAPITVGNNATIGAGSTITKNTPENQLTLSRAKQISLSNWQRPKKEK